jgi:hypothetical protein
MNTFGMVALLLAVVTFGLPLRTFFATRHWLLRGNNGSARLLLVGFWGLTLAAVIFAGRGSLSFDLRHHLTRRLKATRRSLALLGCSKLSCLPFLLLGSVPFVHPTASSLGWLTRVVASPSLLILYGLRLIHLLSFPLAKGRWSWAGFAISSFGRWPCPPRHWLFLFVLLIFGLRGSFFLLSSRPSTIGSSPIHAGRAVLVRFFGCIFIRLLCILLVIELVHLNIFLG